METILIVIISAAALLITLTAIGARKYDPIDEQIKHVFKKELKKQQDHDKNSKSN